jgi:hypothetical protein
MEGSISALSEFLQSFDDDSVLLLVRDLLRDRVAIQVRLLEDEIFTAGAKDAISKEKYEELFSEQAVAARETRKEEEAGKRRPATAREKYVPRNFRRRVKSAFGSFLDPKWIKGTEASCIFGVVICFNALVLGLEVDYRPWQMENGEWAVPQSPQDDWIWTVLEYFFSIAFSLEIYLRVRADGLYGCFIEDPDRAWNRFDALLVGMGLVDVYLLQIVGGAQKSTIKNGSILRILRLLKLLRIFRLFRMFTDLYILLKSLSSCIYALAWFFVLLFTTMWVTGIVLTRLMRPAMEDTEDDLYGAYGLLRNTLWTLFVTMTGENWVELATLAERASGEYGPVMVGFFVVYIVITNVTLMSLVTGVIVDKIFQTTKSTEMDIEVEFGDSNEEMYQLQQIFQSMCGDDGKLRFAEFERAVEDQRGWDDPDKPTLKKFGVFLGVKPDVLFNVLDRDGSGVLEEEEFVEGVSRMKGSNQSKHLLFVHSDLHTCAKTLYRAVGNCTTLHAEAVQAAEQMTNWVKDLWLIMQQQATNRWCSDPFHSSLHQMVENIHDILQAHHRTLAKFCLSRSVTDMLSSPPQRNYNTIIDRHLLYP